MIERLTPEELELKAEFTKMLDLFGGALLNKLLANEQKYRFGYSWKEADWKEQLQRDLLHHVEKGDPRDVAIFGLFAWFHGWKTAEPLPTNGEGTFEYCLCSQAAVDHLASIEISSPFRSGYKDDEDYYYVAKLDITYGSAYYEKVIKPFNVRSTVHLDFWYRVCNIGTMEMSELTLTDCQELGLFRAIEQVLGLTNQKNRALVIHNLASDYGYTPIELINAITD